jgi:predicted heme/steroid binding protein
MLPKNAPYSDDFSIEELSKYDLSGGQINLIVKNTAYKVAVRDDAIFKLSDFIEEIQKEKDADFDSEKSMGFLNK